MPRLHDDQEPESPKVRLAVTNDGMPSKESRYPQALNPPSIRLAHVPGAQGDNNLLGQRGVEILPVESRPALLVSFFYIKPFLLNKERYAYRDWALDSGAFSARNSGAVINLQEYIDCCLRLMAEDPTLTEIFALDVIGDWKATLRNTEEMWRQGVPAIPCYHYADNKWDILKGLAKDYPKIALGGMADLKGPNKKKFVEQSFARVWPKKIHGFGCAGEKLVMGFPWHSVDATNWEVGPCKYGRWASFGAIGGANLSVRGSKQNLRAEVEYYLELERRARERWRKEMVKLDSIAPDVRLTVIPKQGTGPEASDINRQGFGKASPTVRLAHKKSGREEGKGLEGG